jgi:hypothetical protein
MNPPYGRDIGRWVDKLHRSWKEGAVPTAIALLPARTDTNWFRTLRDVPVCFVEGRLRFSGQENGAPVPSAVFYLGADQTRFAANFSDLGDIYCRLKTL